MSEPARVGAVLALRREIPVEDLVAFGRPSRLASRGVKSGVIDIRDEAARKCAIYSLSVVSIQR